MPGSMPKPPAKRKRRNPRTEVGVVGVLPRVGVPPAPSGLLANTVMRWEAYWSSPVGGAANPVSDRAAVERLFRAYDEMDRVGGEFRRERVVEGSTGQPTLHPLGRYIATLNSEILQLEDRLGLSPKARAQLGLAIAEAKKTLGDLATIAYDDE